MEKIKIISDPILSEIKIDDLLINQLIETKEFKRLGLIKHLGITDYIFPTATHTRLSHSLGVYELARRVLEHLNINLELSTKRAILAAALLHDVGHGPFSHHFESISRVSHETYSILILKSPETEINQIFSKIDPQALLETIEILKGKHHLKWANEIISSEIDVDRLDYLLRDSMFSGKAYGNIDWNGLINSIQIKNNELVFNWNVFPILESIILGRYHMNQVIYKNFENVANSELFKWFFNRLKYLNQKKLLKEDYQILLILEKKEILDVEEFLRLDDVSFLANVKKCLKEDDLILRQIANHILNFKSLTIIKDKKEIEKMKKKEKLEEKNQSWTILKLDLDFRLYQANKNNEAKILTDEGKVIAIRQFSSIVRRKYQKSNELQKLIGVKL